MTASSNDSAPYPAPRIQAAVQRALATARDRPSRLWTPTAPPQNTPP